MRVNFLCTMTTVGLRIVSYSSFWVFSVIPPADYPPPVYTVAAATKVSTEHVFSESVDNAHNSKISSTFQEADCLLKLVKVNKQVFAIPLLNKNLNHTAQLSIGSWGGIILSVGLEGSNGKNPPFLLSLLGRLQINSLIICR